MIFTVRALTFNCHSGFETGCNDRTVNQRKEVEQQQRYVSVRVFVLHRTQVSSHCMWDTITSVVCCTQQKSTRNDFYKAARNGAKQSDEAKDTPLLFILQTCADCFEWNELQLELSAFLPRYFSVQFDRTLLANNFLFLEFSGLSTFLPFYKKSWANKRTNEKNPLQLWYIQNSTQINICIRCCVWFSLCCYRVIVSGVNAPKGNISYLHLVLGFATLRC